MPRFGRGETARGPVVQSIGPNGFVVDGQVYPALILTPERARSWQAPALPALGEEELAVALSLDPPPEFLLLGTGANHQFPPRALVAALEGRGIGIEAMDSRAAARTWGLLRSEERWIAAALMPLA